jgi:hypothetical protein
MTFGHEVNAEVTLRLSRFRLRRLFWVDTFNDGYRGNRRLMLNARFWAETCPSTNTRG